MIVMEKFEFHDQYSENALLWSKISHLEHKFHQLLYRKNTSPNMDIQSMVNTVVFDHSNLFNQILFCNHFM